MIRTHRLPTILAASCAALALGAAPALAGSDGCAGGDCQDENAPAPVLGTAPTPVAPLQAPTAPTASRDDDTGPERSAKAPRSRSVSLTRHQVRAARTHTRPVPRGAVAAGAGGTAPHGPEGLLAGIAGAGFVLLAAGGGLVASGRRTGA
jgi:hypothetical protein